MEPGRRNLVFARLLFGGIEQQDGIPGTCASRIDGGTNPVGGRRAGRASRAISPSATRLQSSLARVRGARGADLRLDTPQSRKQAAAHFNDCPSAIQPYVPCKAGAGGAGVFRYVHARGPAISTVVTGERRSTGCGRDHTAEKS